MRASLQRNDARCQQDWPVSSGHLAMTPGLEGRCPAGDRTGDAAEMNVAIAIRPGNNLHEQTLAFRVPASVDPAELVAADFALSGGQATFTVAWVHEGDPDDGYFDAPFGESGQTLSGAVNIAKRRLQLYLRARGMTSCFTYHDVR